MKKGIFRELKAFAPWYLMTLRGAQCIMLFIVGFYLCALIGWPAAQAFLPILVYSDVLLDYTAFAGVSIRRQKTMEWVKSSAAGEKFVKGALTQDLIVRLIATMSGYLGVLGCAATLDGSTIYEFLAPVVFIPFTIFVGNMVLMLSHRIGGTITMHFMLCLAGMIVGEVIAVLAGLAIFCDGSDDLRMIIIKSCIAFAMFTVLAVITSIWLLKDAKRGYESGFFDGDPVAAPKKSETA